MVSEHRWLTLYTCIILCESITLLIVSELFIHTLFFLRYIHSHTDTWLHNNLQINNTIMFVSDHPTHYYYLVFFLVETFMCSL